MRTATIDRWNRYSNIEATIVSGGAYFASRVIPQGLAGRFAAAQLIYDVRKHHISVFGFQDRSLQTGLDQDSLLPKKVPYNMETWSQGGLRYFVIGDASTTDIDSLVKLFRAAGA